MSLNRTFNLLEVKALEELQILSFEGFSRLLTTVQNGYGDKGPLGALLDTEELLLLKLSKFTKPIRNLEAAAADGKGPSLAPRLMLEILLYESLTRLNKTFGNLDAAGAQTQGSPLVENDNDPDLSRLIMAVQSLVAIISRRGELPGPKAIADLENRVRHYTAIGNSNTQNPTTNAPEPISHQNNQAPAFENPALPTDRLLEHTVRSAAIPLSKTENDKSCQPAEPNNENDDYTEKWYDAHE